jgi:hypothetical protein
MGSEQVFSKPHIVTEADLIEVLTPYIVGFPWALDTIGDLWRMGAPDPSPRLPGTPERRILHPGAFASWWAEVQARAGTPIAPEAAASQASRQLVLVAKGGHRRTRP